MLPYTGDYIEHIDPGKNSLKFYSFTPRPLMRGHMYQMDDELAKFGGRYSKKDPSFRG